MTRKHNRIKLFDYIAKVNNAYDDSTEEEESDSSSVEMRTKWDTNAQNQSPDYNAETP